MSYAAPLFDEAWAHRRHRRRTHALLALCCLSVSAAVAALLLLGRPGGHVRAVPPHGGRLDIAASHVLSRAPYMGVHCRLPNSIACDRVGLAVWLKSPAVSVTATIAGAPLALNRRGDLIVAGRRPRREFDGYLQPAGIVARMHVHPVSGDVVVSGDRRPKVVLMHRMWYGDVRQRWPTPTVRLVIHYPSGRTVVTRLRVPLATGWG